MALCLLLAGSAATAGLAYQALLSKAKKYGAKDCLFCHKQEDGGAEWNERGQWLIDEKVRRKAEKVDAEWLADYKPPESEKKEPPDEEEKPLLASRKN